jgi:hypothetical protein
MKMSDDRLLEVYDEYMALTDKLLGNNATALEVAPIMIRLGLEIYKTIMSEEDYNRMVDYIADNRDQIQNLKDYLPEIH